MLYYREYPAESSDRLPVMCLPGLTRNSRDFDWLAGALQRDCRVVCMDVAGRGDSEQRQKRPQAHSGASSESL